MPYSFLNLARDVLKDAPVPLTYGEIWEQAKQSGLVRKLNTQGATPWSSLGAGLSTEILHNPDDSIFVRVGRRPQRYFLKDRLHEVDANAIPKLDELNGATTAKTVGYDEKDLHPLLAYFAYTNDNFSGQRQIYTKTIKHQRTRARALREWLHPDMVGVYFPFEDLEKSVIKLSGSLNSNSVFQLFSFELKRSIDRGNYREYFFQAVSNSSWAHEGYLVAAEISGDDELRRELGRLTNAFGIGVIHLNVKDIAASDVLFRASTKAELDWETINKLCTVNEDFASFINRLNTDFGAGQIHQTEYDAIITDPATYVREKLKIDAVE